MTSWFAGLGRASSGLEAARYGLNVVSQNMANANTAGYTRQVANQVSVDGGVGGIFSGPGTTGGTAISGTARQTDPVLDSRVRNEHARSALADTTATQLNSVETVFQEPTDDGLSGQLSDFWNSWGALANNPGSSAVRSVVVKEAATLAGTLNTMSGSFDDVVHSVSSDLGNDVAGVNVAAGQLAELNGQIAVATATGTNANGLLDQRDQLLDTLSKLAGATATLQPDGSATVTVGGQQLVNGVTATTMSVDSTSYALTVGGAVASVGSGSIGAKTTALTTTLPGYRSQLDAIANSLISTVNSIQAGGRDQAGNTGTAMFTGSGAGGIAVALTDPSLVAAASASSSGATLDGSNALAASQSATAVGSPDAQYAKLVGGVAASSAVAQQQSTTQDAVTAGVDSLKSSVSGVSLDEEAASMLQYQQAFNASSRVLTTIDSMLDTLINHTGLVGLS